VLRPWPAGDSQPRSCGAPGLKPFTPESSGPSVGRRGDQVSIAHARVSGMVARYHC
jgi:hypothetical protein